MGNFKIIELTKENKENYLDKIVDLENMVLDAMIKEGREGQLFTTGKEDISEYVDSNDNTVMIAVDNKDQVIATTYITQGQKPFTYNDITKYFKYGEQYQQYVKSLYKNKDEYKKDMLQAYEIKMKAYKYAREKILEEYPQYQTIMDFLEHELADPENNFHEKSELRENLNRHMSEYIIEQSQNNPQVSVLYERFYWTSAEDIANEFGKNTDISKIKNPHIQEYEKILTSEKEIDTIFKKQKLEIHEKPNFDCTPYYKSNTTNTIELDTYLTNPNCRSAGLARIIVFEGMKKHMEQHFKNPKNQEIFLCSTLHRDNLSSKYVSEFFGLKDSLFVKRRTGRDREVHICRINREDSKQYMIDIENKLAVLYGYNPNNRNISSQDRKKVLTNQLEYEKQEFKRLNKARKTDQKFSGKNIKFLYSKAQKIEKLKKGLENIDEREGFSIEDEL